MLNNIWMYIVGAVGAAFAVLMALLKREKGKREEAEKQVRNEQQKVKQVEQTVEIQKARQKVQEEARDVQAENESNRGKRPTGNFGDKRL